jgi:hypothetical protein
LTFLFASNASFRIGKDFSRPLGAFWIFLGTLEPFGNFGAFCNSYELTIRMDVDGTLHLTNKIHSDLLALRFEAPDGASGMHLGCMCGLSFYRLTPEKNWCEMLCYHTGMSK